MNSPKSSKQYTPFWQSCLVKSSPICAPLCSDRPAGAKAGGLRWIAALLIALAWLGMSPPAAAQESGGDLTPIPAIQSTLSQGDDSAYVDQTVTIAGIVTGVYGGLFFVQEDPGAGGEAQAWSGIAIYARGHGLAPGDEVRITGQVQEYYDLTQILPSRIQTLSRDNPLPPPVPLSARDAGQERWEGVRVILRDLTVTAAPNQYGEWRVQDGSGSILVDDKGVAYDATVGEEIPWLVGIVDHAFGSYRLIPESLADIGGADMAETEEVLPVYAVQGAGLITPYAGQWLNVYGQVTGVNRQGFFLQDPVGDGDPATSDGLYVYLGRRPLVEPGDCVLVRRAEANEFYEKTELIRPAAVEPSDRCGEGVVQPVPIPAAVDQQGLSRQEWVDLFEPVEGMLVVIDALHGIVQGPTKRYRGGGEEIGLLGPGITAALPGQRLFHHQEAGRESLFFLSNEAGMSMPDAAWGDTIHLGGEAGPILAIIDYTFGKYQIAPLPGQPITVIPGLRVVDEALAVGDDRFDLCTANLLGLGRGTDQFPDDADYTQALRSRAMLLAEGLPGCAIIALQEAGHPEDVANLAGALADHYGLDYIPVAQVGPNSNTAEFPLSNGLLARGDRVTVLDAGLFQGCSGQDYGVLRMAGDCPDGGYPLFNRPPLVVDLAVSGPWGDPYALTVIANHWKSKGGDESMNVIRRTRQARHVASLVQERLSQEPEARIVVIGDLNDFYASGPVRQLVSQTSPSLIHTYDFLPDLDRYTYIFDGASQVLDHVLVSPGMLPHFAGIAPLHISADFPTPLEPDPDSLYHVSDHDPVQLVIRPQGAGWVAGNLGEPGLTVTLSPADATADSAGVQQTTTDALGNFRLWGVVPGTYTVRVEGWAAEDLRPAHLSGEPIPVTVHPGAATELTANPAPTWWQRLLAPLWAIWRWVSGGAGE